MKLLNIQIKNWQLFSNIRLELKDFLVFTGNFNSGKSAFFKAMLFFFQVCSLHKDDIKDITKDVEISGTFKNDNGDLFNLKLTRKFNEKEKYYINNNISKKSESSWHEITEKEYKKYISKISLFYIPANLDLEQLKYLLNKLFERKGLEKYINFYHTFNSAIKEKISFSYYRHLFIDLLNEVSSNENNNFWENCILLWEKPEFYLTPQEERECYEILLKNSHLNLMILVSTTSSRFIELNNYHSLCLFRKTNNDIEIFQYQGKLFSGDEITNFNMNYWINPDRSEIFFAKKVILVEGQTDKIVLSYLAKKLKIYNYSYSIIECGSKSTIPQFIRLLNAFKIPYVAVYDKDNHYWRNESELFNSNQKNILIQKTIKRNLGSFIEFENDIEEEIYHESRERKNYKNKPFFALETVVDENYKIPINLEKKLRKIFE